MGKFPGEDKDLWHPAGQKALLLKVPTTDYALPPQNKSSQEVCVKTNRGADRKL